MLTITQDGSSAYFNNIPVLIATHSLVMFLLLLLSCVFWIWVLWSEKWSEISYMCMYVTTNILWYSRSFSWNYSYFLIAQDERARISNFFCSSLPYFYIWGHSHITLWLFFVVFDSPLPLFYAIYVIKCYGFAGLANPLPPSKCIT